MNQSRILIVEDEPATAISERTILQKAGYEVVGIAPSGKEAIRLVEKSRPELILMDIKLIGEMTGKEAARIIKEREDIPLIFVSALKDQTAIDQGYTCLNKPFTPESLLHAVEAELG